MIQMLTLKLLGSTQIFLDEKPVTGFITAKAQALFIYLAVTERAHNRDVLGALLWPNATNAQARKNLRDILPNLRVLVGSHLIINRETVAFDRDKPYQIDVEIFRNTIERLTLETPVETLKKAVDLYAGEFLVGSSVRDSENFEEWLLLQREQLHMLATRGLAILTERCLEQQLTSVGLQASHRLLQLDPLHEQCVCNRMKLLALDGDRNSALRLYEEFAKLLQDEVNATPLVSTTNVYEEIRIGDGGAEQIAQPKKRIGSQLSISSDNLPRALTPLIGRTEEVGKLSALLCDPHYPLITVVGEGGVGKTRLAIVTAEAVKTHFADAVWYVPMAEIVADETAEQQILYAMAKASGYRFVGSTDAKSQLFAFLEPRHCLLILDNFEHLVHCAELILELISTAHELKILITSRQRLNLGVEYVYRLSGLAVPTKDATLHDAQPEEMMVASVTLFVERANRAMSTIALTPQTQQAIEEICSLVDGLPLAIELAAGLVDRYTCVEISQLLRSNYDILASTARDLPSRQRSMKVVLDTSYAMLNAKEQRAFAYCSVFQGGFTNQSALAVTGTSPNTLAELVNNSMIHRDGVGRLTLHELMSQYAAEQLRNRSGKSSLGDESEQSLRDRHCAYFTAFLEVRRHELASNPHTDNEIFEELDNIRSAWQWGLNRQRRDDLLRAQSALFTFLEQVGYMFEADTLLRQSIIRVADWLSDEDDESTQATRAVDQELLLRLLLKRAWVCIGLSQTGEADRLLMEVFQKLETIDHLQLKADAQRTYCELAQAMGDNESLKNRAVAMLDFACANHLEMSESQALAYLGLYWLAVGDAEQAEQYLAQVRVFANRIGNVALEVSITNHLATVAGRRGNISQAIHYLEESLQLAQGINSQPSVASALYSLALQFEAIGLYAQALTHADEALRIYRRIGNRKFETTILCKLGALRYWTNEHESAYQLCEQALRMAQNTENREVEADCHLLRGQIYLDMQQFDHAMEAFQQSFALFVQMGEPGAALLPHAGIAVVHWLEQNLDAAKPVINEVIEDMKSFAGRTSFYPEILYLACYGILVALQDPRADELLRNGYERVIQQASKLLNPNWRRTYLEEVKAVREIIRLATAQWQPGHQIKMPPGLFTRLPQTIT